MAFVSATVARLFLQFVGTGLSVCRHGALLWTTSKILRIGTAARRFLTMTIGSFAAKPPCLAFSRVGRNAEVKRVPIILTTPDEVEAWMRAP